MSCCLKNVRARTINGVTRYYDLATPSFPEITDPVRIASIEAEIAAGADCDRLDIPGSIVPECFCWNDTVAETNGQFFGYGRLAADGSIESWEVISGDAPSVGAVVTCCPQEVSIVSEPNDGFCTEDALQPGSTTGGTFTSIDGTCGPYNSLQEFMENCAGSCEWSLTEPSQQECSETEVDSSILTGTDFYLDGCGPHPDIETLLSICAEDCDTQYTPPTPPGPYCSSTSIPYDITDGSNYSANGCGPFATWNELVTCLDGQGCTITDNVNCTNIPGGLSPIWQYGFEDGGAPLWGGGSSGLSTNPSQNQVSPTFFGNGGSPSEGANAYWMTIINDPNIYTSPSIPGLTVGQPYQVCLDAFEMFSAGGTQNPSPDPIIEVRINGQVVIPAFTPQPQPSGWGTYSGTWVANSTSAVIEVVAITTGLQGNDLALDNIVLKEQTPAGQTCTTSINAICPDGLLGSITWTPNGETAQTFSLADTGCTNPEIPGLIRIECPDGTGLGVITYTDELGQVVSLALTDYAPCPPIEGILTTSCPDEQFPGWIYDDGSGPVTVTTTQVPCPIPAATIPSMINCRGRTVVPVSDECASIQRESTNDLLYQVVQNTNPSGPCSDFVVEKFYQLEELNGELREREWFDTGQTSLSSITHAGSLELLSELPLVNNVPTPSGTPDVTTTATDLNMNDTHNTAGVVGLQIRDGWVVVERPFYFRMGGSSRRYNGVWLGKCCGTPKNVYSSTWVSATVQEGDEFVYIPQGIHSISVLNYDVNGLDASASAEFSLDGVTYNDASDAPWRFTTEKPAERCIAVKICKDSGQFFNILTDEVVDKSTLTACPQICDSTLEDIRDLLEAEDTCPCKDSACILMEGFDIDRGISVAGETMTFEILLDGVVQSTVVHDYTTTSDGINVSSYYTPVISAINAVPGWSISLETDVLQSNQGKPVWKVEYSGTGPSQLVIDKDGGFSVLTLDADGMGNIVGSSNWGTISFPFSEC